MTTVMAGELAGALVTAVAPHLAPMAGVTREWLSQLDEGVAASLPILYDDTREDEFIVQDDPARAAEVLRAVWGTAPETAMNAEGTGNLSHPSTAQFVTHRPIHGAHHRGQGLLALKVNGFPLPDEDALWGPLRGE